MKKAFLIVLCVIAVLLALMTFFVSRMYAANMEKFEDLPYTDAQARELRTYVATYENLPELSNRQWKAKINDVVGYSAYIELSKIPPFMKGDCDNPRGRAWASIYNTIYVKDDLQGIEYASVLLHELVHLVHWTMNETRTQFLTFKLAYESNDPYMKLVAMEVAEEMTRMCRYNSYNATGRVIDYLGVKGVL